MAFRLGYLPEEYPHCELFKTVHDVAKCSKHLLNDIKCTFASEVEFYPFDYYDSYSNYANATFSTLDNETVIGALGLNLIDAYFDFYEDFFSDLEHYAQFSNVYTDTEVCLYTHKEIVWHAKSLWSFAEPLTNSAMISVLSSQLLIALVNHFVLRIMRKTFSYFHFPYSMTVHLHMSFVIALWSILTKVNYADKQVHHRKFKTIEELNRKILSGDLQFIDNSVSNLSEYFVDVLSEVEYQTLSPALTTMPVILAKDLDEICMQLEHNNSIVYVTSKLNMRSYCKKYFKFADEVCLYDGPPRNLASMFSKGSHYAETYNRCTQMLNADAIRSLRKTVVDELLYSIESNEIRVPLIQTKHVVMPMGLWFFCLVCAFLCFCVEKATNLCGNPTVTTSKIQVAMVLSNRGTIA